MKTMAVSFGDGKYSEFAKAAVKRFQRLNDTEGMVLDIMKLPPALPYSPWAKAWIWDLVPKDVERVVWLDADVVPIKSIMDLLPDFEVPFCAVLDSVKGGRQVAEWYDESVVELPHYFNSGVFVAHRQTEAMFKEWQEAAFVVPQPPHWDQTPLNKLLAKHFSANSIYSLPPICNWMFSFGAVPNEVRIAHLAGWADVEARMNVLRLFAMLAEEPTQTSRIERGAACAANW